MSYLEKAEINTILAEDKHIHSLSVVFCPGAFADKTVQVGGDLECHAYIDVDRDEFPIAIELRGWKQIMLPKRISQSQTQEPSEQERKEGREKFVKEMFALAFELLKEHKDKARSLDRIPEMMKEAGELIGAR